MLDTCDISRAPIGTSVVRIRWRKMGLPGANFQPNRQQNPTSLEIKPADPFLASCSTHATFHARRSGRPSYAYDGERWGYQVRISSQTGSKIQPVWKSNQLIRSLHHARHMRHFTRADRDVRRTHTMEKDGATRCEFPAKQAAKSN